MISVALSIFGIALFAILISAFVLFDRLIRYEYRAHREAWERDGKPTGYLFSPPEATWFRSRIAAGDCSMGWLFWTPPWIRDDSVARALLSRMRWCVLVWNIGIILFFLLLLAYIRATPSV